MTAAVVLALLALLCRAAAELRHHGRWGRAGVPWGSPYLMVLLSSRCSRKAS